MLNYFSSTDDDLIQSLLTSTQPVTYKEDTFLLHTFNTGRFHVYHHFLTEQEFVRYLIYCWLDIDFLPDDIYQTIKLRNSTFKRDDNGVFTISTSSAIDLNLDDTMQLITSTVENAKRVLIKSSSEITAFSEPLCSERQLLTDREAVESAWLTKAIYRAPGTYPRSVRRDATDEVITKEVISIKTRKIAKQLYLANELVFHANGLSSEEILFQRK